MAKSIYGSNVSLDGWTEDERGATVKHSSLFKLHGRTCKADAAIACELNV